MEKKTSAEKVSALAKTIAISKRKYRWRLKTSSRSNKITLNIKRYVSIIKSIIQFDAVIQFIHLYPVPSYLQSALIPRTHIYVFN